MAAAAARCGASYLVTANRRHFDADEAKRHGFTVIDPDCFGVLLMNTNPAAAVRGIQRTPQDRFCQYMEGLKSGLPRTYELLAREFMKAGDPVP